jgi:hypothetical protein
MHRLRWDLVVSFEGVGSVINGPQIYLTRGMKNSPWHLENYTQLLLQLSCRHVTLVSWNVAFWKRDRALAITLLFPGKYSAYIQNCIWQSTPFEGQGNNLLQLQMLLKGIKRNTTSTSRTRLPIDSIINDAGKCLPCGYFSSIHTSLILTGFINYRWDGILTVPGRFSQLDSLKGKSIINNYNIPT